MLCGYTPLTPRATFPLVIYISLYGDRAVFCLTGEYSDKRIHSLLSGEKAAENSYKNAVKYAEGMVKVERN